MPTETIVIAIIVAAFGVFAGALYWGDLQTREPGNAERSPGNDFAATASDSTLSALWRRDAGQQVERR